VVSSSLALINLPDGDFQIFNFNGLSVRSTADETGEPQMVADDICKAIDIANTSQAVSRLDDDEKPFSLKYIMASPCDSSWLMRLACIA